MTAFLLWVLSGTDVPSAVHISSLDNDVAPNQQGQQGRGAGGSKGVSIWTEYLASLPIEEEMSCLLRCVQIAPME